MTTTHPFASDSGLNLDHLEALARAATPGPWSWWTSNSTLRLAGADGRDGGVLYGYARQGDGDVNCAPNDQAFIAAANPAALLALIALARRAQPEGEAPKAEPVAWMVGRDLYLHHDAIPGSCLPPLGNPVPLYAATLSPLFGAQHAESGKKATVKGGGVYRWYVAYCEESEKLKAARACIERYKALAAQQAAAPGTLDSVDYVGIAARIFDFKPHKQTEEHKAKYVQFAEAVLASGAAPSAPGTPEAPADLPRLYRFDCYVGKTKMAAGVGVHASTMEEAEQKARKMIDKEETIKFESNQPCHATRKCGICAAYERAAQLDGGQEGSD